MKRPGLFLIISLVILLGLASGICFGIAEYSGSHVFKNALETTGVNVKIEATGGGLINPGEITEYNPVVTNLNADSFIRVRFDADPGQVFGLESGWIKKGNCYYYKMPLSKGESRQVFSRIRIPEDCSDELSVYRVRATVDAIQAKNFQPDFSSISPWGTVRIEQQGVSAGNQTAFAATQLKNPDFNYVSPGIFECSTEDLFSNFENFQPGDTYSEMLNMRNNSGRKMAVYFRTDNQQTALLREMQLKISCCGSKVYEGSLSSKELESFMKIASIENGQAGRMEFQIGMPESADNRYAMLKDNVTWIIAVKDETEGLAETGAAAKTGDNAFLLPAMTLMTAAVLLALIAVLYGSLRRKRK